MSERVGASLRRRKGFTQSTRNFWSATLTPVLAIALPAMGLLAALSGVAFTLGDPQVAGVSLEPVGAHVESVDPSSQAWAAGIRPGQIVLAKTDSTDPDGWSLVTSDGAAEHAITERAAVASLRLGLAPATIGAAAAFAGLVSARRRRRRAELLGAVALFLAWVPLVANHDPRVGPMLGLLASVVGAIWIARWSSHRLGGRVVLVVAITLDLASIVSRALGATATADVEGARFDIAALATAAAVSIALGMTPKAVARQTARLGFVDVVVGFAVTTVVVVVQIVFGPPLWVPILILVLLTAAYRPIRRTMRHWIDRAVFAEGRERAAIESAESERARLSRELHDDPLQSLVGVILRLEEQEDTEHERETLRAIAAQLRNIAVSLHPPVLDDLGLVPAVESLFSEAGPIPVDLELHCSPGFRAVDRPPFEVELATYRIIQEAATNAIRHSGCHRIVVRGDISPAAVSIDVVDDGRGIRDRDIEDALRGGHLGVASMRRRAEAIDARLAHEPAPDAGTIVRLRWSA